MRGVRVQIAQNEYEEIKLESSYLMFFVHTLHIDVFEAAVQTVHLLHHNLLLVQYLPLPPSSEGDPDCHDAGGCHQSKDGGVEEHLSYFEHLCQLSADQTPGSLWLNT